MPSADFLVRMNGFMTDYMPLKNFLAKISWEGGVWEALDYGLRHTDLDPAEPKNQELRIIWKELEHIHHSAQDHILAVEEIMEELEE